MRLDHALEMIDLPQGFLHPKTSQSHVLEDILKRLSNTFTSNAKREFVSRDQVFLFTCHLQFIISTPKLVVSRNFSSIRIVLSRFYLLIFHFEFLNLNLTFAACVKLKLSTKY